MGYIFLAITIVLAFCLIWQLRTNARLTQKLSDCNVNVSKLTKQIETIQSDRYIGRQLAVRASLRAGNLLTPIVSNIGRGIDPVDSLMKELIACGSKYNFCKLNSESEETLNSILNILVYCGFLSFTLAIENEKKQKKLKN